MASHRVPGAKEAVYLVRNADRVNSLFDVIGDVAGTVNGALGAAVVFQLNELLPQIPLYALSLLVLGVIASLTVGSKASERNRWLCRTPLRSSPKWASWFTRAALPPGSAMKRTPEWAACSGPLGPIDSLPHDHGVFVVVLVIPQGGCRPA